MAIAVGDTVTWGFTTGTAGETFTFNLSRNPNGNTFLDSTNITDLTGGEYLLSFVATVAGNYYARFTGNTSAEVIIGNWRTSPISAGDVVTEGFYTGTAAETFSFDISRNPLGATFLSNSNVTDLTGGDYLLTFTTTVEGSYFTTFTGLTSLEEIVGNWDVDAAVTTVTVTGAQSQTLRELRRRVADRFDDYVPLIATATGNAGKTTIIDLDDINEGEQHYNGAQLLCTSGTNSGLIRTILATDKATGTITLNAALTAQTHANDTFDIYNRTGRRFKKAQYDRAINAAINDAFPMAVVNLIADIVLPFDANSGEIVVPAALTEVDDVEAQDSSGRWYTVPKARGTGDGWFADSASGELRLYGFRGWAVNSLSLRVFGKGRQSTLSADTDVCVIDAEFIVARACYHLAMANVTNDDMAVRLNIFRDESERARVRIARLRQPWSAKVRAA